MRIFSSGENFLRVRRRGFYAADALSAKWALERFGTKWKPMYPDAVKCLVRDFEAITAYLAFPKLEWMHLRTTNIIERLHNCLPVGEKQMNSPWLPCMKTLPVVGSTVGLDVA